MSEVLFEELKDPECRVSAGSYSIIRQTKEHLVGLLVFSYFPGLDGFVLLFRTGSLAVFCDSVLRTTIPCTFCVGFGSDLVTF